MVRISKKKAEKTELGDRQPPHSLDSEVALLGSLMILPDVCDDVMEIVRPEDFYDEANGKLFWHLEQMHSHGQSIDITLLRERLIANHDLDLVGGVARLAEIFTSVPTASHAVHYAGIVREKSILRKVIGACTQTITDAFDPAKASGDVLNVAEERVFSIRDVSKRSNLVELDKVLNKALDRLEARIDGNLLEGNVETGFADLDALMGGLHGSEFIVIAARPSMGKTAFAMNIAENIVLKYERPVLFVSLEMSAIELVERLMCSVAKVDSNRLRNGRLNSDEKKRLIEATGLLSKAQLFIDDSPTRTVSEIASVARRIIRGKAPLAAIVVDYLQLIQADDPRDPRQEQVATMARRLKAMAREFEIPVVCLAQLNRQAEDTRDHRPRLSHLRESGAIEQDADVVMFVHRKDYYRNDDEDDQENKEGEALIIVAKQRNGPTGDVPLTWLKKYTRFENRAPDRFQDFDQFASPTYME